MFSVGTRAQGHNRQRNFKLQTQKNRRQKQATVAVALERCCEESNSLIVLKRQELRHHGYRSTESESLVRGARGKEGACVASPSTKKLRATSKASAAGAAKTTTGAPSIAPHIKEPVPTPTDKATQDTVATPTGPPVWTILLLFSVAAGVIGFLLAFAILGGAGDGGSIIVKESPKPTNPCFFDYPVRDEVSVPMHCSGGQPRLQCPVGGLCANGKLFACAKEYTELSKDESQCIMTESAKSRIAFLEKEIITSSIAILCDVSTTSNPVSFFAKFDDKTGNPLFWFEHLSDHFGIRHKSDFIRAANEEPGGPFFLLEDDVLVGIAGSASLDVPITCKIKTLQKILSGSFTLVPFTIISGVVLALAVWLHVRKNVDGLDDTSSNQVGVGVRSALSFKLILKNAVEATVTALSFPSKERRLLTNE